MGIRINQNIAAMNAYRNLSVTEGQMSKSLERLSSGFRINRAADDAAGLAISEKLRGQVGGLKQAVTNAQNGISLIQTAEGALNESHSILQRMRELAVQSANDTNTTDDRTQIQKEINQLAKELTRIGESTEFNTKKLLDGSFANGVFQIGANEGQTLSVSVSDVRAGALGMKGVQGTAADIAASTVSSTNDSGTTITVNEGVADGTGYTVTNSSGTNFEILDGAGTVVARSSDGGLNFAAVDADGNAGNEVTYTFGTAVTTADTIDVATGTMSVNVTTTETVANAATATELLADGTYTVDGAGTGLLDSNGTAVTGASIAGTTLTYSTGGSTAGDSTFTFGSIAAGEQIVIGGTGTSATISHTTTTAATDNNGSTITVSEAIADGTGYTVSESGGTFSLMSGATLLATSSDGLSFKAVDVNGTVGDEVTYTFGSAAADGDTVDVAAGVATLNKPAVEGAALSGVQVQDLDFGLYTVDAAGTSVTDAEGNAVGTYTAATGVLADADGNTLATFTAGTSLSGVTFEVGGVDLSSSSDAAQKAITAVNAAIENVSGQRSTLGAVQNRLDHTINNLSVAAENLSASESRIRDTDMAAEMMAFTRAQILSQAGTAMMAQANQVPQSVLQLLR